jgi:hypothetical protein
LAKISVFQGMSMTGSGASQGFDGTAAIAAGRPVAARTNLILGGLLLLSSP